MKLKLPLSVTLPRKTKADKIINLNLNWYRNAHHMILNQAKVAWKDIVEQSLRINKTHYYDYPEAPFKFIYTIHPANKRSFDNANVCSIINKFTEDALVELGIIKDDNYHIVAGTEFKPVGSIDKGDPHCELEINHVEV